MSEKGKVKTGERRTGERREVRGESEKGVKSAKWKDKEDRS